MRLFEGTTSTSNIIYLLELQTASNQREAYALAYIHAHKLALVSVSFLTRCSSTKMQKRVVQRIPRLSRSQTNVACDESEATRRVEKLESQNELRETSYLTWCYLPRESVMPRADWRLDRFTTRIERHGLTDRKPTIPEYTRSSRQNVTINEMIYEREWPCARTPLVTRLSPGVSLLRRTSDSDQCRTQNEVPSLPARDERGC